MGELVASIAQTLFRFFPFPTRPGLRVIGNPGHESPVLVTCNFDLTVRRVMHALEGMDCFLLVAPSKGINVWCAAAGGILSAHAVISVVKTSRIGEMVSHRLLILPQLAAPGVDIERVRVATGWTCMFGPVYAKDIREYLDVGLTKTHTMRLARFPIRDRLEMAVMWGFPISVLAGIPVALVDPSLLPGALALVWGYTLMVYALYEPLMTYVPGSTGAVRALVVGIAAAVTVAAMGLTLGRWRASTAVGWSLSIVGMAVVLGFDLDGTSPLRPGSTVAYWGRRWPSTLKLWSLLGFHMESYFELGVLREACAGCGTCEDVCPTGVYQLYESEEGIKARVAHADRCEQCTACVKQCPAGAILADPPISGFRD